MAYAPPPPVRGGRVGRGGKKDGSNSNWVALPARVYGLSRRALLELLEGRGAQVGQVVGRRAGDDAIPDDGLVGGITVVVAVVGLVSSSRRLVLFLLLGPLGRDVDKDLLGVPREQARQVGVETELDDGVLFFFCRVVVRAALDDLHVGRLEGGHAGSARRREVGGGDQGGDDEGDGREEAEDVLEADDGAVHCGGGTGPV